MQKDNMSFLETLYALMATDLPLISLDATWSNEEDADERSG